MTLCSVCETLQYDILNRGYDGDGFPGLPFHQNFLELKSCIGCGFCSQVANDITINNALNQQTAWRDQYLYLRLFPSTMPPDESDNSNLLVYSSPHHDEGARDQTTLATYGLFLERTEFEFKEGKP